MKTHVLTFLLSSVLLTPVVSHAATNTWVGASGDWAVATNWSAGAVPAPTDLVVIPAGPTITVTHSSNNVDTVASIQSQQAFVISGGSITVTSGASQFTGSFTISNGTTLGASGSGTTVAVSGPAVVDDGNFNISGGAVVTFPTLRNFTKECNGGFWTVSGAGSILSMPALTNITGQICNYPVIQASSGGQILLSNLTTVLAGPLGFQADGAGSIVDLSRLTNCNGQNGYLVTFEASSGGDLKIPNLTGGSYLSLTLNPGGVVPTAQLQMLNSLNVYSVTNNFNAMTNLINLVVSNVAMSFPALSNFDDGTVALTGGAVVTFPQVRNYNKNCNGANWSATGAGTVLSFPVLTNLTGQACTFPVIQAEAGGQVLLTNLANVLLGPLTFQADGTNSVIDLGSLAACAGENGYPLLFEVSAGGMIHAPNMTGGTLVGVTINPGGNIQTAQIGMLNTLNLPGTTNNFNALTNLINLTVSGVTMNFPALTIFDDGNISLTAGAVVTMPVLRNYNKFCNGANWTVNGPGTVFSLPALTNITGQPCNFPAMQAQAGGQILASNLLAIQAGPLAFAADGAGSLIDLSSLASCAGQSGYLVTFEASSGGSIKMPVNPGGPLVGVTVNPGGTVPTSQLRMLNSLTLPGVTNNFNALTNLINLAASGITLNFPALVNFDDGNVSLSGGAVITMPAVSNYTKLSCNGANWTVTGSGTILSLPALTNISGFTCSFPVIQAESGGEILLTNLASVQLGPLAFNADGTGSLIDMGSLTNGAGQSGYQLTFEASAGGTLRIQKLAKAQLVGFTFNSGGLMTPSNLATLNLGSITMPTGSISLTNLRNLDNSSLTVSGGGILSLPVLGSYAAGAGVGAVWQVSGSGSQITLPGLTNLTGDGTAGYAFNLKALASGDLSLSNLQSIANGNIAILSDGTGSTIDLSSLSGFVLQNGQGSLTAQNGGVILLNTQAFLLANVSITIPAGNPVLPPALVASSALTLYGQAWHSYLVQQRNTLIQNSPYTFVARVPMTNAFEAIAPAPPPNTEYQVTEFVANPPILDMSLTPASLAQMILYAASGKTNQLQMATNISRNITWTNTGSPIVMTNSFSILPPFAPSQPLLYYRARQF